MSFLEDQAVRMIRNKWKTPTQLAFELFSIFLGDEDIKTDSPVSLDKPAGSTLNFTGGTIGDFTIGGSTVSNGPVTFNNPFQFDPSQTTLADTSGGTTFHGGGFTASTGPITFNDYIQQQADQAIQKAGLSGSGTAINPVFLGRITAGSGQVYQVILYPNGPSQAASDPVSVAFPMLIAQEKLDPNTWVQVFEYDQVERDALGNILLDGAGKPIVDRAYAGFVPTWLDGPP